jgi:hypothetical protein
MNIEYSVEMSRLGLALSGHLSLWLKRWHATNHPHFLVDIQYIFGSECRSSIVAWDEMSLGRAVQVELSRRRIEGWTCCQAIVYPNS